jgi:hypothetical protein
MQERLEAYEESEQALLSESNSKGVSHDRLCLLPDPCKLNSKRAVKMWTGFLYGQPLWTDRGKNKVLEDLWDSIVVYNFAGAYKHDWAQDAALDAIRQMLVDNADRKACDEHDNVLGDGLGQMADLLRHKKRFRRLIDLLEDFTVYGADADEIELWAKSSEHDDDANVRALKEELLLIFYAKAEDRNAGRHGPRLMDECRYHKHVFMEGVGCYVAGESAGLAEANTGGS